jgi:hypothetical protein
MAAHTNSASLADPRLADLLLCSASAGWLAGWLALSAARARATRPLRQLLLFSPLLLRLRGCSKDFSFVGIYFLL